MLLEPGRFLIGNAGVLLTRVLYIKSAGQKKFVIVDAGMNDLIRPALYESYHEIVPVKTGSGDSPSRHMSETKSASTIDTVDIVGPVCESGDFFALDREIPAVSEGDLLAIMSAGAYGFTMASNYNSRPLPAEILVRGGDAKLIRKRQTWEDLIKDERRWIAPGGSGERRRPACEFRRLAGIDCVRRAAEHHRPAACAPRTMPKSCRFSFSA